MFIFRMFDWPGPTVGHWQSVGEIATNWQVDRRFELQMVDGEAMKLRDRWNEAVARVKV